MAMVVVAIKVERKAVDKGWMLMVSRDLTLKFNVGNPGGCNLCANASQEFA